MLSMKTFYIATLAVASLSAATLGAQTLATGDARTVTQPSYPAVCKTLYATHTKAERATPPSSDDTTVVAAALKSCAGTGKSVVLAASGSNNAFYTGTITVNGEGLVIASGVTLFGSNSYNSAAHLILVEGENSFLGGPGTIDGRGDILTGTPRLVQTTNTTNLTLYNLTLTQSRHPNLYMQGGSGATVYGLTILTPATRHNADGIDIDSITNVSVLNTIINAGDDGIAIKTNAGPASNITVANTKVYGTHGLSIGSQTMYGVKNILFSGNYVYGKDQMTGAASTFANAINIKTDYDCGGTVQQVTYKNTCITEASHLIVLNTAYGACSGHKGTPVFSDIVINGVKAVNSKSSAYSIVNGYSANYKINAYLANVDLDTNTQKGDSNAILYLDNVNGWTPSGSGVTTYSYSTTGAVPTCSF